MCVCVCVSVCIHLHIYIRIYIYTYISYDVEAATLLQHFVYEGALGLEVCVYARVARLPAHHIRQHTSAFVSIRQHSSAYVSILQHTSAYARRAAGDTDRRVLVLTSSSSPIAGITGFTTSSFTSFTASRGLRHVTSRVSRS